MLFERFGNFFKRLEIYTTITHSSLMTEHILKIMVQSLSVLALVTKKYKVGQLSKCAVIYTLAVAQCATEQFIKKFLKDTQIDDALQRLDGLTQEGVTLLAVATDILLKERNNMRRLLFLYSTFSYQN
jgi:hypothetical protein